MLPTGDYSILGMEDRVALERKTLADLYACVGGERKRFERELERLADFEYAAVIIEASLSNLLQGYEYSRVHPHSVIGSILAWSVKYNRLPFFFADNRWRCRTIIYRLLKKFYEYHMTESNTNG
jgi:ERCC4-type nuclease